MCPHSQSLTRGASCRCELLHTQPGICRVGFSWSRVIGFVKSSGPAERSARDTRPCRHGHAGVDAMRCARRASRCVGLLRAGPLVALALAAAAPARAQDYPARPITLIVPFVAGGGVDAMGRIVAQKLAAAFGQQVVIENRPGAGGVIGTRAVAKAPADGYTLGMMITGASLPPNTGYDVARDFAPIGLISSTPIVVMTHAAMPAQSLADVIALAQKTPGHISAGTPPPPTVNYLAAE